MSSRCDDETRELALILARYAGECRHATRRARQNTTEVERLAFERQLAALDRRLLHAWRNEIAAGTLASVLEILSARLGQDLTCPTVSPAVSASASEPRSSGPDKT